MRAAVFCCVSLSVLAVHCNRTTLDSNASADTSTAAQADALASPEKAAQEAAEAWLALVDAGKYNESWTEAAQYFKKRVDQGTWSKMVEGVRAPLGKLSSRTVKSARYTTTLPGAPDGEYVVLEFSASFENKRASVETVIPTKDADGRWRVSGYFIK
jgi:hypothetical protein